MHQPSRSPDRTLHILKRWIGLLIIALLLVGGICYRQYEQSQVSACTLNLQETKEALVRFKQARGGYPATWRELSAFTGTVEGVCWKSHTLYTLMHNSDGSVGLTCPVHHTFDGAPP